MVAKRVVRRKCEVPGCKAYAVCVARYVDVARGACVTHVFCLKHFRQVQSECGLVIEAAVKGEGVKCE